MIFILVLISLAQRDSVIRMGQTHPVLKAFIRALSGAAPAALGRQKRSE
jgi:hypothetical protein